MSEQFALEERPESDIEAEQEREQRIIELQAWIAEQQIENFVLRVRYPDKTTFVTIPRRYADERIPPIPGWPPELTMTADMLDGATYYPEGNPEYRDCNTVVATLPLPVIDTNKIADR